MLPEQERQEYDHLVVIVAQFSRINPNSSKLQMISKNRVAAIPAITERHIALVSNARGELTYDDIRKAWRENMPQHDTDRHPDVLFDIAQFNFGSDEPIGDVVRALTIAAQQRKAMRTTIKSHLTRMATRYRYTRTPDDSTEDEEIDEYVDSLDNNSLFGL